MERAFQAYGEPLEMVMSFKYLGRVLTAGDDDWTAVSGNLQKAKKNWVRMLRILIREGADPKISGHFFKAVMQALLLFGSEKWVLTPQMRRDLRIFQHRIERWTTGRKPRRRGERSWEYPPLAAETEETGFEEIRVYVTRRQNTVA